MPKVRFNSGHTEHGRLLPMQKLLAQYLYARGIESPVILDVGIGLGAPTLIDLAKQLKAAGFKNATIIGVDANSIVLRTAEVLLGKAKARGGIPEGCTIHLEYGDICAGEGTQYSLESIARKHTRHPDRLADLSVSSNLLGALLPEEQLRARESLCRSINRDGIVGLGWGSAEDSLRLEVLRNDPAKVEQHFTFESWTEESHPASFLSTLLALNRESKQESVLSSLSTPRTPLMRGA
jgi:hypothetical protein